MQYRTLRSRPRLLAATLSWRAAVALLASSCRSPLEAGGANADCTLSFIVGGRPGASLSTAAAIEGPASARLLLPMALSLTVTLSPAAGATAGSVSRTVPIATSPDGSVKASVTFHDNVVAVYEVEARAMDASGAVLFRQISSLDMNASSEPVKLNLVSALPVSMPELVSE